MGKTLFVSLAKNPRAVTGSNSGAIVLSLDGEKLPPKALRILNPEHMRQIEVSGRIMSALFRVARKAIMEKRKGGEEGRALRRFLIHYARSLGCPVWECAIIFDLNRKQIGQEEGAYIEMLADYSGLDKHADYMTTMLDFALKVNVVKFLAASIEHINADNEDRRETKKERQAAKSHRIKWLEQQIRIEAAVVAAGEAKGASKEQKREAKQSALKLEAYAKEHAKLSPAST